MAAGKLTWNDAIEKVLREAGHPLNYLDITEQIVQKQLRDDPGPTPSYTVAAQFSMDKKRGDKSRFVWVSTGIYGLREWQIEGAEPKPDAEPDSELNPPTLSEIAVQAYGIFWDRSGVDWRKSAPKLLGQQFENSDVVDFSEQRGIYVLFDHRDVVYVGRATAQFLGSRLRDHTLDRLRSRWDRFSWFGFHAVTKSGGLQAPSNAAIDLEGVIAVLEAVLIELNEPPQNRQQGKGLGGIEYLQRADPTLRKQHNQELLGVLAKAIEANDPD
ncbi:MAG: hypothetical protein AKCLJLPJ_01033 [Fimbriimonadales bacterium]|nr:hypothetical protein [Fimbriimonadales bacterium]